MTTTSARSSTWSRGCGEHRDFVGLLADLDLAGCHFRGVVQAGHGHPRAAVPVDVFDPGTSRRLYRRPRSRDVVGGAAPAHLPWLCRLGCCCGHATADRGVEPIAGQRGERPRDRGRVRRADPHPSQRVLDRVNGPFGDRGERTRTRDHRSHRHEQNRREPVPHTPASPWVRHLLQNLEQARQGLRTRTAFAAEPARASSRCQPMTS